MPSAKPSSNKNNLVLAGIILAALALVVIAWQWAGSESAVPPPVAEKKSAPAEAKTDLQPLGSASTAPLAQGQVPNRLVTVEEGDEMIDTILRSDKEIPQMARDLHDLVGRLNGEAQVNASRHLVNLTGDEDYNLIAGYLVDPKTNPEVIEVLFSDLMNRERKLQLPLFMNILKNPAHPQNEEVKNVMTVLAGEDFGTDYTAWDKWAAEELKTLNEQ